MALLVWIAVPTVVRGGTAAFLLAIHNVDLPTM